MMNLVCFIILFLLCPAAAALVSYNVVRLGAKPDGRTDNSYYFRRAWELACACRTPAEILVPAGTFVISSPLELNGPCKSSSTTIRILGTLLAPRDFSDLGHAKNWIELKHVNGLSIINGILNARGTDLWACKASSSNCPPGATSLRITESQNIIIDGLTSVDSQMYHIVIYDCENVMVRNVKVNAAGHSPNTDGIHVQKSTGVTILDTKIATGDDCVSIGAGTFNLWIERITCGPGHGISIGSLGKEAKEEGVQNVTVARATLTAGATNGFRIKSFSRASTAFVTDVVFRDSTMTNVHNPIIIEQNYCPNNENCPHEPSSVKISNVRYVNIFGTSASELAIQFNCKPKTPCKNIEVRDVKLSYHGKLARTSCANAMIQSLDHSIPSSCQYKKAK